MILSSFTKGSGQNETKKRPNGLNLNDAPGLIFRFKTALLQRVVGEGIKCRQKLFALTEPLRQQKMH